MKKTIIGILLVFCLLIVFGSCDLINSLFGGDTVTAPERVNDFITSALAGATTEVWATMQSHFYGDGEPQDYDSLNTKDYWETTLFADADAITVTGSPADTATTIDATMTIATNVYNLTFSLKKNTDNGNYYITLIDFTDYPNSDDVRFIGL